MVVGARKTKKEKNLLVLLAKVKELFMKKRTAKRTPIHRKGHKINVTLPFELHDWSETLSFTQITDTLFVVSRFLNHPDKRSQFSEADLEIIKDWFTKNDIEIFLHAQTTAQAAYEIEMEKEMFAQEVIQTPYKRPMSH